MLRRYLGGERRRGGGLPAGRPQPEAGGDGGVDAGPEPRVGAVPADRDRVPLGQYRVLVGFVEHELPVGEVLVQPGPVPVELLAVQVVLGPDRAAEVFDPLPQLRSFAVAHHPWGHPLSMAPLRAAPVGEQDSVR